MTLKYFHRLTNGPCNTDRDGGGGDFVGKSKGLNSRPHKGNFFSRSKDLGPRFPRLVARNSIDWVTRVRARVQGRERERGVETGRGRDGRGFCTHRRGRKSDLVVEVCTTSFEPSSSFSLSTPFLPLSLSLCPFYSSLSTSSSSSSSSSSFFLPLFLFFSSFFSKQRTQKS